MRDVDIRPVLLEQLRTQDCGGAETLVVEELGLCQGKARVDVAVVNGSLHGYEIKSERDRLQRLSGQQEVYSRVLDFVTMVVSPRHLVKVESSVPYWWGISRVVYEGEFIKIHRVRSPKKNPEVDPRALVQLLWRDEALELLSEIGLNGSLAKNRRSVLWSILLDNFTVNELRIAVRQKLKRRQNWRTPKIVNASTYLDDH